MDPIDRIILAGYLKRYPRMGSLFVDVKETIAGHAFRAALIGSMLAEKESEDPGKVAENIILHQDLASLEDIIEKYEKIRRQY